MRPNNNVRRGTPNCFCGLSASPAYSEEFGLLYECHYLHNNPWKEVNEDQSVVSETVNGRASPDSDQVRLKVLDEIKCNINDFTFLKLTKCSRIKLVLRLQV